MNAFDLLIIAVLVISTSLGAWRGLLREAVSMLTWVLSILLAWLFADWAASLFETWVSELLLRQLLGFLLVFVLVFVLGMVASWILQKSFPRGRSFRLANTLLGGMVGMARGAVIMTAAFLVAGLTPIPERAWWRDSAISPLFERAAVYVAGYIPRDIARHIRYG